ncbi:MAG TPA: TonB family protein [Bryobacteraceae bacterium]|nr:TonB family protein [Bryobacteraceae bacterium]
MAHVDVLDQRERMAPPFWLSVALHSAIAAALIGYGLSGGPHERWGSRNGGGFGAVAVNTVAQIPLPGRTGPENPVANDTDSQAPTPPPKAKTAKAKALEMDAIALKGKSQQHKEREAAAPPNKWREQQKDLPNQLYSSAGQAMSSPMFGKAGSGQLGMGTSSPFGERLGWYANELQDRVAQHWRTDDVPPQYRSAPQVVIGFTLRRDGSLAGLPQIKQSSGLVQLDRSAQRAVVDAGPFPAIPAAFTRNEAYIELTFEFVRH